MTLQKWQALKPNVKASPKRIYELIRGEVNANTTGDTEINQRVTALESSLENKILSLYIPADAAATDTWIRSVLKAAELMNISEIRVIPDSEIGQATDYMTLTVTEYDNAGVQVQVIGSVDVNSSHVIPVKEGLDIILAEIALVTAGNTVVFEKAITESGQIWPGGLIQFVYKTGEAE